MKLFIKKLKSGFKKRSIWNQQDIKIINIIQILLGKKNILINPSYKEIKLLICLGFNEAQFANDLQKICHYLL